MPRTAIAFTFALFASVAIGQRANACATCGCGDPTLTGLGTEKPYQNRVRGSVDVRHRTDSIGAEGLDRIRVSEQRVDATLAWAPSSRAFLQLTVPTLRRTVRYESLAETNSYGLGDVDLRAKFFVLQDADFTPRHLFSVLAGVKVPTAKRQFDPNGAALPVEAQPGTNSFDPLLGIAYAYFPRPWSFYASAFATMPARGTSDFRASPSARATLSGQYQFAPAFAVRVNADTRFDLKAYENGDAEADSGGAVLFVSPEVLVTPFTDLTLFAAFRYPVVNALLGQHKEGPVINAGVAYDF